MSVGENIKARRKQLGMNAETLAEALGMSPSTIYRYESGEINKVDAAMLIPIANALNTTPAALMGWAEESPAQIINDSASAPEQAAEPDFEAAAVAAAETLVRNKINAAPIFPLQILTSIHNVLAVSFTEFADKTGFDRSNLAIMFGAENQDAITYAKDVGGKLRFFVAYNQRLPFYMLQLAIARELGHIMLGHNNLQPNTVQTAEAMLFARHLLCPRPLIKAITDSGNVLTVSALGNITGCYGRSLAGLRQTPGAHVPSKLNRRVREMFADYTRKMLECIPYVEVGDDSGPADFGTYMDNYED